MKTGSHDAITDVPGVKVGQVEDLEALTGVTVIFTPGGAVGAVDVRGANPGTIHTDALHPMNLNEEVHAIVLTGGSLFGLESVAGVNRYLLENRIGVDVGVGLIPVVAGAVIFDLPVGRPDAHPTAQWGYDAVAAASAGPVRQGNCGGGTGGTAGKTPESIPTKGGTGTASVVLPSGVTVGALALVNALGDVINPLTRELYAWSGFRDVPPAQRMWPVRTRSGGLADSTTIACVATDASLTKTQLAKVADIAHQGMARAIRPIHSMRDGDTVFALSVNQSTHPQSGGGHPAEDTDIIGAAAADVLMRAVVNAVVAADGIPAFPSYRDHKARWAAEADGTGPA